MSTKSGWDHYDTNTVNQNSQGADESWARKVVEDIAKASVTESRRARRWKIFFQFLTMLYLLALAVILMKGEILDLWDANNPHTSLVEVEGVISADSKASADKVIKGLRSAFEDTNSKGIIIRINSPGGSPVQASYIYDEIKRLRAKHKDTPVYAVIVDVGASAAYYIAAATDFIYADKSSIVGSIGVLMNGFGFVKSMENLGIERRLITSGSRKGVLDPFSPMQDEDRIFVEGLLKQIHDQFIAAVKAGRGERLKPPADVDIFNGLFWNGEQAKELGLIDGLGSSGYVAREIIKAEKIVDHTHKEDWVKRLSEQMESSLKHWYLSAMTPTLWY